jgi:hypothetical protein
MDPEKLLEAINAIVDGMRTDMAKLGETMNARYDSLAGSIDKMKAKKDEDGDDETMATRTAADSVRRGEFEAMQSQLRALQIAQPARKTQATLDKFAEVQSRCDAAFIALGTRAEPPMAGEDLVGYSVRMHRALQKHSAKFKGAELAVVARDATTFEKVCDQIRADALEAGLNPVDLKPFEHRMITETGPGGHKITSFVGNGTIFAQLQRPAKRVISIGADERYSRSAGGQVFAAQ